MMIVIMFVKLALMVIGFWLLTLFGIRVAPYVCKYGWNSVLYPIPVRRILRRYLFGAIIAIVFAVLIPY